MSAWDVAGAVVWSSLALMFWATAIAGASKGKSSSWCFVGLLFSVGVSFPAAFCIARLFGAHA